MKQIKINHALNIRDKDRFIDLYINDHNWFTKNVTSSNGYQNETDSYEYNNKEYGYKIKNLLIWVE